MHSAFWFSHAYLVEDVDVVAVVPEIALLGQQVPLLLCHLVVAEPFLKQIVEASVLRKGGVDLFPTLTWRAFLIIKA